MRLEILNTGYRFGAKMLFRLVRLMSGHPMPDAARLVFYRPDFYGSLMKPLTHHAMRGESSWTVGDRELMAAYISTLNQCAFCIGAHTATSSKAYQDPTKVQAALSDIETAPIEDRLRSTLRMLGKLVQQGSVDAEDMRTVLDTGVSRSEIEVALAVCFAFGVTNRLADAFDFEVLPPEGFDAGAKVLLARGYR